MKWHDGQLFLKISCNIHLILPHYPVHTLIGPRRAQSSTRRNVWTKLYVIETLNATTSRKIRLAGIPSCFQSPVALFPNAERQSLDLARIGIATHKTNACDGGPVRRKQTIHQSIVQKFAYVIPKVRTMAPLATVGTSRNIECQGHLSRHLLKNYVVTGQTKHNT